ncbi:hypothetical protein AXG93_2767s1000 [Marchantia polymorpha subsp. ruderalis]|uniref:Uncharacterized protein n=1 Tax=Marchantia polymorpha subsp. ruderalis TaxID=1480154 RepID=A0A176VWD6_MARPO|nr:hypothetical protein AXG93_2767s1000 [Marchantia polymorpha subsp. ruderalis]
MAYAAEVQRVDELTVASAKRNQLHAEELAKAEERRAKEEHIDKDLRGQIDATKTEQVELWRRIAELTDDRDKELQRADELSASLASVLRKHAVELTDWAKKLVNCKAAKSLEVECKRSAYADL